MTEIKRPQYIKSQIGRYEVISEIGRGGMGTVYRAYDAALERPIALKILAPDLADDPRFVTRLRREAVSAARRGASLSPPAHRSSR